MEENEWENKYFIHLGINLKPQYIFNRIKTPVKCGATKLCSINKSGCGKFSLLVFEN